MGDWLCVWTGRSDKPQCGLSVPAWTGRPFPRVEAGPGEPGLPPTAPLTGQTTPRGCSAPCVSISVTISASTSRQTHTLQQDQSRSRNPALIDMQENPQFGNFVRRSVFHRTPLSLPSFGIEETTMLLLSTHIRADLEPGDGICLKCQSWRNNFMNSAILHKTVNLYWS